MRTSPTRGCDPSQRPIGHKRGRVSSVKPPALQPDKRAMDRDTTYRLFAGAALVLGVIAFLAIPTHAGHLDALPYGSPGFPLGRVETSFRCDTFDMGGSCGPRFWLRAGVFGVFAFGGVMLFGMTGGLAAVKRPPQRRAPVARVQQSRVLGGAPSWGRVTPTHVSPGQGDSFGFEPRRATVAADQPAPGNGHAAPHSPALELKTCPDCAEEVRAAARKCRFCNYVFDETTAATS
jgi:hypothetical protein